MDASRAHRIVQRMRVPSLLLLALVFLPLTDAWAEDSLSEAKRELHEPKPSSKPKTNSNSATVAHCSVLNDVEDACFFGELVSQVFIWENDPLQMVGARIHPYAGHTPGYYAPVDLGYPGRIFTGDISAEGGWIDDDLQRYTLGGRLNISSFVLRTEWNHYREERTSGGYDSLNIGTIDAELGITFGPYSRLGLGFGATITHDSIGTKVGPCVAIGLDAFPLKPLVVSGALTYAKVGDYDTEILTWRATVGAIWNRYEFYGGWQSTSVGAVDLDGPTAGLRLWF